VSRQRSVFNPIHVLSLLVCLLLVFGVTQRRRRQVHIPVMLSAIIIDLGIVAYIELTAGAVESAERKMGALMIIHIAISVGVLVLYGIHLVTGIRMAMGAKLSRLHGRIMLPTVGLRLLNFVTSIMVMGIHP